jgi:hypothetical protein
MIDRLHILTYTSNLTVKLMQYSRVFGSYHDFLDRLAANKEAT